MARRTAGAATSAADATCARLVLCWLALCLRGAASADVKLHYESAGASPSADVSVGAAAKAAVILQLNRYTFEGNVLKAPHVAHWIVFFCPAWWEPCQQMEAPFAASSTEWQGRLNQDLISQRVRFARVDCATDKVLCNEQRVDTYPFVAHYTGGNQVTSWQGGTKKDPARYAKWISHELAAVGPAHAGATATAAEPRSLLEHLSPGAHLLDVLLIVAGVTATVRLVLLNTDLWEKSAGRAAALAAQTPAAPATPPAPAEAAEAAEAAEEIAGGEPAARQRSVARLLPESWVAGDRSFEL